MTNGNFTRPGSPAKVTNAQATQPSSEQFVERHQEILGLLEPLVGAGTEPGTACARLCYLATDLFDAAALDSSGQSHVYDVQAMLIGAMKTDDASPAQVAIIEKILPLLDEYVDWLDGVKPSIVGEEQTLEPREYLEFLRMLEGGLPDGTRAYLVSLDDDGKRRFSPVTSGSSVVDLKTNLKHHLNDAIWFREEETKDLLDYCVNRLQRWEVDLTSNDVRQAGIILEQCAMLAKSIGQLAVEGIDKDNTSAVEHELRCIKQLAQQLGFQADLGAEKVGAGPCFGGAEDWMMPPSYHGQADLNSQKEMAAAW